jgi:hypothetical protein
LFRPTKPLRQGVQKEGPFLPITTLAVTVFFIGFRRRKRLPTVMLLILSAGGASLRVNVIHSIL